MNTISTLYFKHLLSIVSSEMKSNKLPFMCDSERRAGGELPMPMNTGKHTETLKVLINVMARVELLINII